MDHDSSTSSYILGIDTGGTYTDSVILRRQDKKLMCKAKALTTKENLLIGIDQSIRALDFTEKDRISSVSLSTTLATNAVVEKKGCKVGLLLIGKRPDGAIPSEYSHVLQGRLDLHGNVLLPINIDEVTSVVSTLEETCDAVAISGYLSIRNPCHELKVKELLQAATPLPVFCAHELSGNLGFYERTITAVLNASLIAVIGDFLASVKQALAANSICAPIMLVKGDGTLMQESLAIRRPVDMVLSGPAASIIGAGCLTDRKNAMIYDMGGTTSDITFIEDGSVYINPNGATVGCWQTHIRAANIYTFGIGGDSYIHIDRDANICAGGEKNICADKEKNICIGPEKVEPLCVSACRNAAILPVLKRICHCGGSSLPIYYKSDKPASGIRLSDCDRAVYDAISGPCTQEEMMRFVQKESLEASLHTLVVKGLVVKTGLTPTDIKHARGSYLDWNRSASTLGVQILANALSMDTDTLMSCCETRILRTIVQLCEESAEAFGKGQVLTRLPIIGIGAPAKAWLPPAAESLKMTLDVPKDADVANAIGAALCPVSEFAEAIIRYHKEKDVFVLFMPDRRMEFDSREAAEEYANTHLGELAKKKALRAGGVDINLKQTMEVQYSCGEYIQSLIRFTAADSRVPVN